MSTKKTSFILEIIRTVIFAVVLALILRTVAYEPFTIPSGSMLPALLVGDFLFVSKFSYGYSKYTFFNVTDFEDRIFREEPERGDIAVFKLPTNPNLDYIKRVIGLPGDRIQLREGTLYINNNPVPRIRKEDIEVRDSSGVLQTYYQFEETLPNGKTYTIFQRPGYQRNIVNNTTTWTVPENHYFMLGDNRDNSKDSRFRDVGYVPIENFVGRAEILFFSVDREAFDLWDNDWLNTIRFERIFMPL